MSSVNHDKTLEKELRRRKGAFYTQPLWGAEAHKELSKAFGPAWYFNDDIVVWDCCAGTGNLTRGYTIKNLLLSTLLDSEVDILQEEQGDKATVFKYDFLNSDLPSTIEAYLKKAAREGKRLIFLMNPPYATAGVLGEDSKVDVAKTLVNGAMKSAKIGASSQQLYAQFLFQAEQIASQFGFTRKTIAVFSPISFMVSGSFKGFRSYFYDRYAYQTGFMFQASQFADVKGSWGVSFTLWSEGKTSKTQDLRMTIKDKRNDHIYDVGVKDMYCSEGREASEWVRQPVKGLKTFDAAQMKSGLNIGQDGRGTAVKGSLLYLHNAGNNIQHSAQLVGFYSTVFSNGNGLSVLEGESWRRAIALYAARKLSKDTWQTHNDEYLAPNTQAQGYEQWVDDCHIYALLHTSNNMTAMRQVEYKGKKWDINNHFFWLTKADALKLYASNSALLLDCRLSTHNPYFASVLPTLNLSPLAKEIMDDLNALLKDTLTLRTGQEQRLQLTSWDAGIYQLKQLWSEDPRWITIKEKHRRLATQLRHGVYTYGFLKR